MDLTKEQIDSLEGMYDQIIEDKWYPTFEAQSGYMGNGIYTIAGLYNSDTRTLFLMFIHQQQTIEQQGHEGWSDTVLRSRKKIHYYKEGVSLCGKSLVTQHNHNFAMGGGSIYHGNCAICVNKQKEL